MAKPVSFLVKHKRHNRFACMAAIIALFRALPSVARHFAGRRLGGAGTSMWRDAFSSERWWVAHLGSGLTWLSARVPLGEGLPCSFNGVMSRL